ncbi:MAG: DUF11 domain-containing protein, partial [Acidobacteria bacterium]|nr:DUF11 domain-containing protein [Acidobacteriota bacterium]
MHQFGRALGLEVLDGEDHAHKLMSERMAVGVRRVPGTESRVQGTETRVQGSGFRVPGTEVEKLIGILSGWGLSDSFSNGFKVLPLYNNERDEAKELRPAGSLFNSRGAKPTVLTRVQGPESRESGIGNRESGAQIVTTSYWTGSGDRKDASPDSLNVPAWNPEPRTLNPEPRTPNPEPGLLRSGETVNTSIGALPAGKSVTVRFDVTIDNPPTAGTAQVCNQGTVSGGNFSNVVTDDPDVAGVANSTCTQLDAANLAVTKSDAPDPVIAGSNITYTVNFTNNGPSSANTVTVTDAVPTNTTFVSATVTTGTGWSTSAPSVGGTGNVVFSKASVANAETAVFTIVVQVGAGVAEGTTITNSATAASPKYDPNLTNNTGTTTTTVIRRADLAVTKSDSPDPVVVTNNLTYTINFTNNGPNSADTVTVTDGVPTNTTFVSATVTTGSGWGTSAPSVGGTGNVVFSKASVANGETAVFTIVVNVNGSTPNGTTITNTATAASTTTDPVGGNNSGTATTTVNTQADLAVTKSDSPDPVIAGNNITYTVNFSNSGPGDATTVTVTDAVPTNTTFVSASVTTGTGWSTSAPSVGGTGNVVFSKATVTNGETAVFTIVVKVNANAANGSTITNTATAGATTSDPVSGNNSGMATTTVNTSADLSVTKSDSPDPVTAGNNVTYTVNFTNNGPSDAQTVTVTDGVPTNTTFVSASVTTGTGWSTSSPSVGGTGNVVFSKATVAASETAVFTIVVKVNSNTASGATITNTATAATATTDPTGGNNSATATTTVNTSADLSVSKSDSPDPVTGGNNLTYTVNFSNNGPSDAQTVTVTDGVPTNTTFVSATVTTGTGWSTSAPSVGGTGNVVFSKATVGASETAVFSIVVKVNASTASGTVISNTAATATATTDPSSGNNSGTATTTVSTSADLAVTKGDSPDPTFAGNTITYTVNFSNNGPSEAQTVTVTDGVPTNTTFVSATVTTGTGWSTSTPSVGGTGNVVFSKATVGASETAVFTIVVTVDGSTAAGTVVTNTATAASVTTDPNSGNNSGMATTTIQVQTDLAVTKSDSPDPVTAGTNLTYTINFVNNGPGNASSVTVTDGVPVGTTFVSASVVSGTGWSPSTPTVGGTGNVVFSKASVANGETAMFQIVVNVNSGVTAGSIISNTATAGGGADPNPANNSATATTTVTAQADLSVTKTDSPDPVGTGGNLTYTVNFTNNGPSAAQTVTVTDGVPTNTTFVSASVTTGTGWSTSAPAVGGTGNVVFSKATVGAGETAQFEVVVAVNTGLAAGTTINNSATAASSTTDPVGGNNSGTAATAVIVGPNLAKAFNPPAVPPNSVSTLTFTVTNPNPGVGLTGVSFTDNLPVGMEVAGTPNVVNGCGGSVTASPAGTSIVVSGITLAPGASCTISVDVLATGLGSLVNTTDAVTSTNGGTGNQATATLVSIVNVNEPFQLLVADTNNHRIQKFDGTT